MKFLALWFAIALPFAGLAADDRAEFHTVNLASLIAPEKLATLGKRGANPRIQKAVAMMEAARRDGCQVATIASNAVSLAGYTNALLAKLTRDSLTRNHAYADKLGVLNEAGLDDMKRGQAATIPRGTYKGDQLSVDHVVPVAVAPELDNVVANLELMPLKLNEEKNSKMGTRQRDMAKRLCAAGLLTSKRLDEILKR